ncbi:MAG: DEAD/DEAH box helicase family protein [Alphaproteobacteria bacterium]
MANFSYLAQEKEFLLFAPACLEAEKVWHTSPAMSAIGARKALELAVKWVYAADKNLEMPYNDNIQALIHERTFRFAVNPKTWPKLLYIIKLGNLAVHTDKQISQSDALEALSSLFEFIQWLDYSYGKNYQPRKFDNSLIPSSQISIDIKKIKAQQALILERKDEIKKYQEEIAQQREELALLKQKNQETRSFEPMEISEWETRKRYIDVDLKLMGWKFDDNLSVEYPIDDMMNIEGQIGKIDYVLFGKNGKPLALIEAKRTSKDPNNGRQQAKLYADSLERKFAQRPMIFTTNGFETYFHDDKSYPQRLVFSVFSQDDLAKLMQRRIDKRNLNQIAIKDEITNRYYQKEAIKSVCDHVDNGFRRSLLVMATGTGKTRTAISLADVLARGNYATNILFLADRTALVSQAKSSFKDHLPNMSLCNLLSNKDDKNARVVFSTYPTMLNAIDSAKNKDGQLLFTPAHFDLIIIDEAHRSIFKKYKTIFDYFDAIIVGLTATPKTEVDRNTYDFFEMEQSVPTYAYDYETAVKKDEVLVPYHNIEVKTKFLEEGIVYDNLSDEDKKRYEEDFADEDGLLPKYVPSTEINKFIFNESTVDKVLQDLMTKGIKVSGGTVLGKTIIFAQNKKHAQFIIDRFEALYPNHKGVSAKRVVCDDSYAQTIIDEFKQKDTPLRIAVSVDMMDTGIDVPDVVNLVFFKKIRSKAKFWQMIGRGTRLCPNLYCSDGQNGSYQDKKYFYIFDYLGNFEFFRTHKDGLEGAEAKSLFESIFAKRVHLIKTFQDATFAEDKYQDWRKELISTVVEQINVLNTELVAVRAQRKYIDLYNNNEKYTSLNGTDVENLTKNIAPLVFMEEKDEYALQVDNFIYAMMLSLINKTKKVNSYKNKLIKTATELSKKTTLFQIKEKLEIITPLLEKEFVDSLDIYSIEDIRINLRELIKFLVDTNDKKLIITDLEDTELSWDEGKELPVDDSFENYRQKVNQYILKHTDYIAIYKLRNNQPLTKDEFLVLEAILTEELGSKEDYNKEFGDTPLGLLVRKIAKLDKNAAMEAFSNFINDQSLNQQQIVFVHKIVDFIVQNGYMETSDLIKAPFDRPLSFIKLFDKSKQTELVTLIQSINNNALNVAIA